MNSPKKVWPIKTASSCQYKWAWSTIYLNLGTTNSCHQVGGGHLDTIEFKDFHNHPLKIKDRELMLEGKWPNNACHYCKRIEDAGGISERNGFIQNLDVIPPEFDTLKPSDSNYPTHVTPRILEVYFSNLCNQGCTYCSPMFSSVLEQEVKKHGLISKRYGWDGSFVTTPHYNEYKAKLWEWMEEHSIKLYDFHILGGEPLFQPEFEECLTFFETHSNPDLCWKMFSNLKHDTEKFKVKIKRMADLVRAKKLRRVEIVCSIDCWGPEQEFARHGMSLQNWEDNFNALLQAPEISITIQSTISSITLPTAFQLTDKIANLWNSSNKPVIQGWNVIANPPYLDPSIFGHYMTEYVNKLVASAGGPTHCESYLTGFATQIKKATVNKLMMLELRDFLDMLDKTRNQNWRSIYPWMDTIFKQELNNNNE